MPFIHYTIDGVDRFIDVKQVCKAEYDDSRQMLSVECAGHVYHHIYKDEAVRNFQLLKACNKANRW